jgi:hypothetical protein
VGKSKLGLRCTGLARNVAVGGHVGGRGRLAESWVWVVEATGKSRTLVVAEVVDGSAYRRRYLMEGINV